MTSRNIRALADAVSEHLASDSVSVERAEDGSPTLRLLSGATAQPGSVVMFGSLEAVRVHASKEEFLAAHGKSRLASGRRSAWVDEQAAMLGLVFSVAQVLIWIGVAAYYAQQL